MTKTVIFENPINSLSYVLYEGIKEHNIKDGIVLIQTLGTRSAIITSSIKQEEAIEDLKIAFEELIPSKLEYSAEVDPKLLSSLSKSTIIGKQHTLIIENGELSLGDDQDIYSYSFDGSNDKVIITYI